MQGRVTCFYTNRHFGFIAEMSERGEDFFFHQDDLVLGSAIPEKGQFVAFDEGLFRGRKKAVNVRILTTAEFLSGKAGAQ